MPQPTEVEEPSAARPDPAAIELSAAQLKHWQAAAAWYHHGFTGIILSATLRQGTARAAELVHEVFSRQRQERFLPGLQKLGLDRLPHAVAAAQYHYLSNAIGGVSVQYMPESERKAWVRYPPPRWVWSGTALCAVPSEVSRAMMTGWHAQNGVSLGNPRLGFVCTGQTTDGDPGLEGYYFEYDRDLAPHERLRFARGERAPAFDPSLAPRLTTLTWPRARLAKAHRNYAMEYLRTCLPAAIDLWGAQQAQPFLHLTLRLVGMQHYHETRQSFGLKEDDDSPEGFADFIECLVFAQGDACESIRKGRDGITLRQTGWRLMDDLPDLHPAVAPSFDGLLQGALAAHNHRLSLRTRCTQDLNGTVFNWLIADA
jgi:hypothetical protein